MPPRGILILLVCLPACLLGAAVAPAREFPFRPDPAGGGSALVQIVPKQPGHYTPEMWRAVIDATWGTGLPTADKLAIFDTALAALDERYASYQHLDVDLPGLIARYRPEIAAGVSRGRFAGIMCSVALAMQELHTTIQDLPVVRQTGLVPGVPLLVMGSWAENDRFGACVTVAQDGRLIVYKALPNHFIGIEAGDEILGYDGVPWRDLVAELRAIDMPVHMDTGWGSSPESLEHSLLAGVGLNWHLFDTLDVVKHASGDTLHIPTWYLQYQSGSIWGNPSLPPPGAPFPDYRAGEHVGWGVVEGTDVGYIHWLSCSIDPEDQVRELLGAAVDSLMFSRRTSGLIVDIRQNFGGSYAAATDAYALLFDTFEVTCGYDQREPGGGHYDMEPWPDGLPYTFAIRGQYGTFYDRPIAVLTSPGTISAGDLEAFRLRFHPNARSFGLPTCGAFCPSEFPDLGDPDWHMQMSMGNGYRYADHEYLVHRGIEPDERVWFTADAAAAGRDPVVERALAWIAGEAATPAPAARAVALHPCAPNPFNPRTAVRFELDREQPVRLTIHSLDGRLVRTLVDGVREGGQHAVEWDGCDATGRGAASGAYLCRLRTADEVLARRMLLLR